MSSPLDNGFDPPQSPLDPELNPLTNQVLAENLGRWSQVYFTTPPERRADAVRELLRELQNQPTATKPRLAETEEAPTEDFLQTAEALQLVACSACQENNLAHQRYCGFCGSLLQDTARPAVHIRESVKSPLHYDEIAPAMMPVSESIPARAVPEIPFSQRVASTQANPNPDLDWIRNKALSRDDVFPSLTEPEPPRHAWKYMTLAALLLLCGGFLYLQWSFRTYPVHRASEIRKTTPAPAPQAPQGPAVQSAAVQSTTSSVETAPASSVPAQAQTQNPADVPMDNEPGKNIAINHESSIVPDSKPTARPAPPEAVQSAAKVDRIPATPVPGPFVIDTGAQELGFAQRYLENSPRDSTEAARWLWKAVSKQNTTALVLLSKLYSQGDGVPKSCDQARLLLVAAAKKGNPEAGERLRNFDSNGCR